MYYTDTLSQMRILQTYLLQVPMKKGSIGILLLCSVISLLLVHSHAQANQYAVFAFSWLEGHCQQAAASKKKNKKECDPEKTSLWDHQSFTIHGLWVTHSTTKHYGDFDLSIITNDTKLHDDMNNYWPPQSTDSKNATFLWEHEWKDHGHAYAQVILDLQPQRFRGDKNKLNRKLQHAFFNDTVTLYKNYTGVIRYPNSTISKQALATRLGINDTQLNLVCVRANVIREFKICFELTSDGPQVTECRQTANQGCSPKFTDFILPAWNPSRQSRVIK